MATLALRLGFRVYACLLGCGRTEASVSPWLRTMSACVLTRFSSGPRVFPATFWQGSRKWKLATAFCSKPLLWLGRLPLLSSMRRHTASVLERPSFACSLFVTLLCRWHFCVMGDTEASDWHYEICIVEFLRTIRIKQSTRAFTFFLDFCTEEMDGIKTYFYSLIVVCWIRTAPLW